MSINGSGFISSLLMKMVLSFVYNNLIFIFQIQIFRVNFFICNFSQPKKWLEIGAKLDCVKYITIYCIYWIFSNSLVERLKRSLTASAELLQTASRREGSCDILSQSVSGEDWANSFEECRISCTVTLKTFLKEIFLKTLFHHIM